MKELKNIFTPLSAISKRNIFILFIVELIIGLLFWQFISNGSLFPTPIKLATSLIKLLSSAEFIDNLFSSLSLTLKGMGISIFIALIISYISLIPIFNPIAKFIIKCRYLTLTGLIFMFTLLTKNGSQLKLSLLLFGIVPFFVTSLLSIIDEINTQEYDLCKTLRMNNWKTLWEVIIVGRLDMVFDVMRQNFAIAWMMITMVEGLSMSEGGLGTLLIKSNKYLDLTTVFSILIVVFLLGVFFDFLLGKLRFWLFPYSKFQIR